ncbi:hypothetical protein RvY_08803, partial [Ramazzottius varieornatus]
LNLITPFQRSIYRRQKKSRILPPNVIFPLDSTNSTVWPVTIHKIFRMKSSNIIRLMQTTVGWPLRSKWKSDRPPGTKRHRSFGADRIARNFCTYSVTPKNPRPSNPFQNPGPNTSPSSFLTCKIHVQAKSNTLKPFGRAVDKGNQNSTCISSGPLKVEKLNRNCSF